MCVGGGVVVMSDPACVFLPSLARRLEPELDPHALGCLAISHLPTLALAVPQAGNGC